MGEGCDGMQGGGSVRQPSPLSRCQSTSPLFGSTVAQAPSFPLSLSTPLKWTALLPSTSVQPYSPSEGSLPVLSRTQSGRPPSPIEAAFRATKSYNTEDSPHSNSTQCHCVASINPVADVLSSVCWMGESLKRLSLCPSFSLFPAPFTVPAWQLVPRVEWRCRRCWRSAVLFC